jgi:hypothetical protein
LRQEDPEFETSLVSNIETLSSPPPPKPPKTLIRLSI